MWSNNWRSDCRGAHKRQFWGRHDGEVDTDNNLERKSSELIYPMGLVEEAVLNTPENFPSVKLF